MDIKTRIIFNSKSYPDFIATLDKNNVPYETNGLAVVEMLESSPLWPIVSKAADDNGIKILNTNHILLFTKKELDNAEWLYMRSTWKFGYPQPENAFGYTKTTYAGECPECGKVNEQIAPFKMKSAPKWNKRAFCEVNWVGGEMFLSDAAKGMFTNEGITGVSFLEVWDKKENAFPDISQLVIETILEPGYICSFADGCEARLCSVCKTAKHVVNRRETLKFKKHIFDNQPDIVKTGDLFGDGHFAGRMILVRNKVYKAIVANKMNRTLEFQPIELI